MSLVQIKNYINVIFVRINQRVYNVSIKFNNSS